MPDDFDLMDLLAHLASQMFLDPDLGAGVSKEWLENEAKRFFWAIYNQDARNRAARAAREVIEFVTGRSWIMTGSGLFSFSHRTFLEYFFAKHLHNETKDPAELAARLCDRIANGEWHVSAHLAIQLVIASRTKMATMVGDSVAEQLGVYLRDNPSFRSDILAFLMDFLEYLAASENTIEKIARMVGCYGTLMPISRDLFTRMLNTINPRRLAVYVGITEGVCDCVRMCEAEPTALARVLDWIYELSLAVYGQTQEGSRDAEFIKVWRNCAPQVFREKSGAAFAKWLFDCSGEVNENMLQYGLALWTAERPFYERTTFLGTDFILMASELQRYVKFGVPIDQLPYANLAVAIAPELRNQAPIRLPKDSRCFNLQLSGPINWSSLFNVELDKKGFACIVIALLCYELSARTEFREIITERERQEIRGCIPLLDRFLEHAPLNDETRFLQLYRQTRLSLLV